MYNYFTEKTNRYKCHFIKFISYNTDYCALKNIKLRYVICNKNRKNMHLICKNIFFKYVIRLG